MMDEKDSDIDYSSDGFDNLYGIKDSENDYSSDEFGNEYEIKAKKLEMGSDIDDDSEDDLPNVHAWGNKARKYFGTDYVDKDGSGITDKERRIAEAEEEEGIAAQKRLIEELDEFDFDCFQDNKSEKGKLDDLDDDSELQNLDLLNEKESKDFLRRLSPEFFIFKQDYDYYSQEVKIKLEPIINKFEDAKYDELKKSYFYKFLVAKYGLIQRYLVNISFYMLLKTKGINVKSHPIRSSLNIYRKLVKQTDEYLENVHLNDLNSIIKKLKEGDFTSNGMNDESICIKDKKVDKSEFNVIKNDENRKIKKSKKKVKFEQVINLDDDFSSGREKDRSIIEQSKEEKSKVTEEEAKDKELYSDEEQDEKEVLFKHSRNDVNKRKISKMIEKNKGLTPYRKRDYRNPRVRYKGKYQKAEIKRKSQVKEPIKEIKKYSGEFHGIKISAVRSVRFK